MRGMAGCIEFCHDITQSETISSAVTTIHNKKQNKCSPEYSKEYQLSEPKAKRCATLHSSACNELVAATSTLISFELTHYVYDLFAVKMLQFANNASEDNKHKYNKRRRKHTKRRIAVYDDERYVCDCEMPCSQQKRQRQQNTLNHQCNIQQQQRRRSKQISTSRQTANNDYERWPNSAATTESAAEAAAAELLANTMNASVAEMSTTDASTRMLASTTACSKLDATLLRQQALFVAATKAYSSQEQQQHVVMPSTIKFVKPITITTTTSKSSVLSVVRNAFVMIALLLTVLTLQRVSGQYHLSLTATTTTTAATATGTTTVATTAAAATTAATATIAATTAATTTATTGAAATTAATAATITTAETTTATTVATKSRSMLALVTTNHIGLTTTNPVSSTYAKNPIFDNKNPIKNYNVRQARNLYVKNPLNNYNDRQAASNQSEAAIKKLKTKSREEIQTNKNSLNSAQTLLQQLQWSLAHVDAPVVDTHAFKLWQNAVGVLSSATSVYETAAMRVEQTTNAASRRQPNEHNKSLTNALTRTTRTTHTTSSRPNHKSQQRHSNFSYFSTIMPKLQNAHKRTNSLIQFSKHIYKQTHKSKLFNVPHGVARNKRSVDDTFVKQQKSNYTQLYYNGNGSIDNAQQQLFNNRSVSNAVADKHDFALTAVAAQNTVSAVNNSNINTNNYGIKNANAFKAANAQEHNINEQKLLKLVMDGLGLQQLPNMKKVNISQREYVTKYREYLRRVHERKRRELAELPYALGNKSEWELENVPLHIVSIAPNVTKYETYTRRKRHIQDLLEVFQPNKAGYNDDETVTENFSLPRKQRNNVGKVRQKPKGRTTMLLHFALEKNAAQLQAGDVEEANIRLMLIHNSALAVKSNKKKQKSKNRPCDSKSKEKNAKVHVNGTAVVNNKQLHILNLKVYQRLAHGKRVWLDSCKVNIELDPQHTDDTHSQWLQFDVTKAVEMWLREQRTNLGLEVHCDHCQRVGARILNDMSAPTNVDDTNADDVQLMPILNIIGRLGVSYKEIRTNKHSNSAEATQHHHNVATFSNGRQRPHGAIDKQSCHKANQRCCRHTMEVVFKEIKGFEFIIQPKIFDAGYCHGRCPPRYNPAHHHAMLQSLIWKQNRERAPRPCCAPSKLVELEVLHVDEKDSEKLKISTWTDMRVVECACS